MDFFRACLKKNQGLSIFKGHRPGACPGKMFSWDPDAQWT